jgi:cytochrome P450
MTTFEIPKEADVDLSKFPMPPDPATQALEDLDPTLQMRFATDTVDPIFARLRKEAPVHRMKQSQYGPLWNVTRYKDIVDVEIDTATFSSDVKYGGIYIKDMPKELLRTSFINQDSPLHDIQRKVVSPVVAPANLKRMEEHIRREVNDILDGLPIGETFDWVDRVSVEVTNRVLSELMETPRDERRLLTVWSDIVNVDLAVAGEIDTEEKRYAKLKDCAAYFAKIFEERKKQEPGRQDLISMLAHSPATADMTPQEFLGMIVLLMVGGNDTTRNSITGGLLALSQFPAEYDKLIANHNLVTTLVPEIIRWVTPVPVMRRTVTKDTEFRGQKMKQGDKVLIWYISGNRDEEMIPEPYQFKVDRANPRTHLSFGMGIHRCLGNRLAELQLQILWQEILRRNWRIDVVGPAVRKYASNLRGFGAMPVKIRA